MKNKNNYRLKRENQGFNKQKPIEEKLKERENLKALYDYKLFYYGKDFRKAT